jgi:hypothetical protein
LEILPQLKIDRFDQLAFGDLFLGEIAGAKTSAIKAVDRSNRSADPVIVILGPAMPKDTLPGTILPRAGLTAISFGQTYRIKLPTHADGWQVRQAPPREVLALGLVDGVPHVRANFDPYPGQFNPCHLRLTDGELIYDSQMAIMAYAIDWEIVVQHGNSPERSILKVGG